MNTAGKFRLLLDMSRKQSRFIPDDWWSDIGRYRRAEAPRYPVHGGWYFSRPVPTLQSSAWHLGPNSATSIADSRCSTAMKRVNESQNLPSAKSSKVRDQREDSNYNHLGASSSWNGCTHATSDETYRHLSYNHGISGASNMFNDYPRPTHYCTFARHHHHSSSHFSNETHGADAVNSPDMQHNYPARDPRTRLPEHEPAASDMTRSFQLNREWHTVHSTDVEKAVLQSKLLELNRYLYHKCDPQILKWDYRWDRLRKEMQELDADILCLQEVEEHHFECDILKFLTENNYDCHYKRRTGNNKNKPDGVLVAFKNVKFELLESRKVEYRRGNVSPVNQDNVAVITVLRLKRGVAASEDSRLCVVNTHLLYNPKRGEIKLAQLSTLFAEVHDVLSFYNASKVPILMCGDFNSVPHSQLFNFITTQELKYEGLASKYVSGQRVGSKGQTILLPKYLLPQSLNISCDGCVKVGKGTHELNASFNILLSRTLNNADHHSTDLGFRINHSLGELLSSYCHDERQASTTQDKGVTVDYIFHTPYDERVLSLQLNKRLSLVSPRALAAARGIPNAVHPSDHLPIVVDFDLVLPRSVGE